ncbi:MAG TPA: hypothetical protein VG713_08685 [Pirellulales bacterium]|nr:hypothetical protein [Pirellulales bacterium]
MASTPTSLDCFAHELREPLRRLIAHLQRLAAGRSIGFTVFGPCDLKPPARMTSVLTVETVDLNWLRRFAVEGSEAHRAHLAPPLVMTPAAIRGSRDSFPLELLEIQQQHVTLLGDDLFAALEFQPRDVRLQCERELRTMALAMRQALLASGGDERALDDLQQHAGQGLVRVLRGLLWLRGQKSLVPPSEVAGAVEAAVGHSLPGVRAAIDHKDHRGWQQFERLYADLEALGNATDGW